MAQIAACIGREFGYDLLAAVAGLAEAQLAEALEQLNRAELVFCHGTPPEATYSFKHVLVRDAAYESLLSLAANCSIRGLPKSSRHGSPPLAEAQPEILAHHLTEAGLPEHGHHVVAPRGRAGVPALGDAGSRTAFLARARASAWHCRERKARPEAELALLTQLGPVLIHTKGWARPEVHDVYSRALEIARGLDQPLALVPPFAGLWVTYNFTARYDAARKVVDEMFQRGGAIIR